MTINRRFFLKILGAAPLAPIVKPKFEVAELNQEISGNDAVRLPRISTGLMPPVEKIVFTFQLVRSKAVVKYGNKLTANFGIFQGQAGETRILDLNGWHQFMPENIVVAILEGNVEVVVHGQQDSQLTYVLSEGESVTIDSAFINPTTKGESWNSEQKKKSTSSSPV